MTSSFRHRRLLGAGVAGVLGIAALATGTTAAVAAPKTPARVLPGVVPGWLHAAHRLGHARGTDTVEFGVLLSMRNAAAADRTIAALTTPGSPSYRHWLTSAQFRGRFAPAKSDVSAVQKWLRSQGFSVDSTLRSGLLVSASGSVARTEKVFGTSVGNYSYRGRTLQAATTQIRVPASLPAGVTAITGISDDPSTTSGALPGPPPGVRYGVQPCSKYYGQKQATKLPKAYGHTVPYAVCGYSAKEFATAYGLGGQVAKGTDGHGLTVAITDAYAAPTILKDANRTAALQGTPKFKPGQFRQIAPSAGPHSYNRFGLCGPQGWYGEETLDVEAVHGVAPGAKVVYVAGRNCAYGLKTAWAQTIDNHVADIVSNSWGSLEEFAQPAGLKFTTTFTREAAMTGISVLFSSGDFGDNRVAPGGSGIRQVLVPASDPYVTAVGGTSVGISRTGAKVFEHGWENAYSNLTKGKWDPKPPGVYSSGSGGGTSRFFAQPAYQKGVVPGSISKHFVAKPHRSIPDISMPGDPNTGLRIGETQQFAGGTYYDQYRIGGTSVSAPLLAGVFAIAGQYAKSPLGFVNPTIYKLAGSSAIRDVRPPAHPLAEARTDFANFVNSNAGYLFRLRTIDVKTSIFTRPGYDDTTGLGSPNGVSFLKQVG